MELRLYDTLTREKRTFTPVDPARVRMYVCGPTVYDFAHIGNARPAIVFDVLFRLLRHVYGEKHVTYVRNITDVDDKINTRAGERGISIRELTEETYKNFKKDVEALGCLPELEAARGIVARGTSADRQEQIYRASREQGADRVEALKAVVPEQRDVADMLRRIQTLATQSSLVVKAFRPQAVTSKTLHQEWPMGLELDGTYHNLARFFDQVSKVPRIINVGGINIKGKKDDATTDGTTITAQCTATTFVLLDKSAQAEVAAAAGPRKGAARGGVRRAAAGAKPR